MTRRWNAPDDDQLLAEFDPAAAALAAFEPARHEEKSAMPSHLVAKQ
jgi:hypothetical protein